MTDLEGGINKNKCVCQTENSDFFFLQSQQNFILSSNLLILITTLLPKPCIKQMLFVRRHKRVSTYKKLIKWWVLQQQLS